MIVIYMSLGVRLQVVYTGFQKYRAGFKSVKSGGGTKWTTAVTSNSLMKSPGFWWKSLISKWVIFFPLGYTVILTIDPHHWFLTSIPGHPSDRRLGSPSASPGVSAPGFTSRRSCPYASAAKRWDFAPRRLDFFRAQTPRLWTNIF